MMLVHRLALGVGLIAVLAGCGERPLSRTAENDNSSPPGRMAFSDPAGYEVDIPSSPASVEDFMGEYVFLKKQKVGAKTGTLYRERVPKAVMLTERFRIARGHPRVTYVYHPQHREFKRAVKAGEQPPEIDWDQKFEYETYIPDIKPWKLEDGKLVAQRPSSPSSKRKMILSHHGGDQYRLTSDPGYDIEGDEDEGYGDLNEAALEIMFFKRVK